MDISFLGLLCSFLLSLRLTSSTFSYYHDFDFDYDYDNNVGEIPKARGPNWGYFVNEVRDSRKCSEVKDTFYTKAFSRKIKASKSAVLIN